jgi:predicted DNA-binding transcriptional regulator AlpA
MVEEEWTTERLRERFGDWLTVEQVAEVAGIKPNTFRTYVTRGGHAPQPDRKLGRRLWGYKPETIAEWLAGRRRADDGP